MKLLKMTALLLIAVSLFGCVDTPNSLKESKTEPNESGSIVLTAQSDEMSREAENKQIRRLNGAVWRKSEISLKPT